MASLNCFRNSWRKKKDKGDDHSADKEKIDAKTLHVKREHLQTYSETTELRSSSISVTVSVKVSNHDSPVSADKDETLTSNEEKCRDKDDDVFEMFTGGHVSDPGSGKPDFWASPKLKRSCSNLAMRRRNISSDLEDQLPYPKCRSYEKLNEMYGEDCVVGDAATSPVSIRTNFSADKVILKKHSSSQILPSRSRKLWWKLFLWSHRNLHRAAVTAKPQPCAFNQHGGYSSDTVEPSNRLRLTRDSTNIKDKCKMDSNNNMWDGLYGVSGMWPQNQWVAFPTDSSPLERVNEWVRQASILQHPLYEVENDHHSEDGTLTSPPRGGSSPLPPYPEEISHANSVIRSLNSGSSVAHITGIGLKAIPSISHFSSLRSLNLSSNFLGHITPGSLPKGLHILNLSRNKITTIECLRDMTRLRVLDLSYNRISRIGQGLSNCTLIKELYLAGNKISVVEGLHRLLKLTVLDLSFNKITTAKALGQLVANYNSLIALNILGNPIQSNIGDEQLRKTICSLLTKLALLNKQPVNTQKAREIRGDANAKAALVSDSWHTRRKRVIRRGGSSKHRSRSHSHHHDHTLKD